MVSKSFMSLAFLSLKQNVESIVQMMTIVEQSGKAKAKATTKEKLRVGAGANFLCLAAQP